MKKIWLTAAIILLFTASCTVQNKGKTANVHRELNNEDIIKLIEQNHIPSGSEHSYVPVTDTGVFPSDLINRLGKAVCEGNADAVVGGLHEDGLRLTREEKYEVHVANDSQNVFNRHRNVETGENYPYFKCDVNGDGVGELLGIEEGYPGTVYLYRDTEEGFELYGNYFTGDVRRYALFPYGDQFYLAVSCDNGNIPGEREVRLYLMDFDNFKEDQYHRHICLRKKEEVSNRTLLYSNQEFSAIGELQAYVDEIICDLSSVSRSYDAFLGDETRRGDLQKAWEESGREFGTVFSIDADNDGTEDYFDRFQVWAGHDSGPDELSTELEWFTEDMKELDSPFTEWRESSYVRKKAWFQIFDGKTVFFSLCRKNAVPDHYVIDARILEDGKTTILYDSVFEIQTRGIERVLSEQMPYSSSTVYLPMESMYENRDVRKAFPENLDQLAEDLLNRSRGRFILDKQRDEEIPSVLTELIREIGYQGGFHYDQEPLSYRSRIGKYEFADIYGDSVRDTLYCGDDEYVYEYQSGRNKYFITASGDRAYTDLNLEVFEDIGGKLTPYDEYPGIDMFSAVQYEDELYLLESHFGGESDLYIHRLLPEKVRGFGTADISVTGYGREKIYGCGTIYEDAAAEYVERLADTLPELKAGAFTGDESYEFDSVKLQRLKSVSEKLISEEPDFMETDFNNDGIPEYFSKQCEGDWELYSDVYQFKEGKAAVMDYTMLNYRISDKLDLKYHLKQLWFKELEGKIFTFRLFSRYDYYVLNASLVRGTDIDQIVSYVIVPRREIRTVVGADGGEDS